jgi:hypothetical protein
MLRLHGSCITVCMRVTAGAGCLHQVALRMRRTWLVPVVFSTHLDELKVLGLST